MKPFEFEGYQRRLTKPSNWDREHEQTCEDLVIAYRDNCCVSHWQPTLGERLMVLFGAGVWLFVATAGRPTQPPVALQAGFARKAKAQFNLDLKPGVDV